MIALLLFSLLLLSVTADYTFHRCLRRYMLYRWRRPARWLYFLTNGYWVIYLIILFFHREAVLPAPGWTLAALVVLAPKLAFLLLWCVFILPYRRARVAVYAFLIITTASLILGGIVLHGGLKERFRVQVNRVDLTVATLPRSFDGYRIAQISDFHLGSLTAADTTFVCRVVDSILALRPDVVCFTGDLVNIRADEARPFLGELARLRTRRHEVFAILGNHDYADYAAALDSAVRRADVDTLRTLIARAGWTLLDNRGVIVRHRAARHPADYYDPAEHIRIVGVGNIGEPPFITYGDLSAALGTLPAEPPTAAEPPFTLLLSHNPVHWRQEVLPTAAADLTLAGHTHGMQIKVGKFSPAQWRYREWGGLYEEGGRYLYVNTGLGTVGFPVRIGLKPEVTLFTLRCGE